MGGLPRRATFVSREKEDRIPYLVLDAGNIFAERAPPETSLETMGKKADLLLRVMEWMGYSAVALGEMDLYLGLKKLQALSQSTHVKVLSANLVDEDGKILFEPYFLFDVNSLKVVVLGLTHPPGDTILFESRMGSSLVLDPLEAAARVVQKVRRKCDLLIILSNLGHEKDLELARTLEGIDIIIGGRSRRYMKKPVIENRTLITSGYFQGRAMGKLMIDYKGPIQGWISVQELAFMDRQIEAIGDRTRTPDDRKTRQDHRARREVAGKLSRYESDMVNLDPSIPDDPKVTDMIREYRKNLPGAVVSSQESSFSKGVSMSYAGPQSCIRCHEARHRFWVRTPQAKAY
jgi:2',3'-cyclic-nucleotide 2'-phosphodiesterase (5'-nucleotidase family)